MRYSRHIEKAQFLDAIRDLRILPFPTNEAKLEHLEQQRILIPKLRLRYPDSIERRWFSEGQHGIRLTGPKEPNGPRWKAARSLEATRHSLGWPQRQDPMDEPNSLDRPPAEWRQFMQFPAKRKFVPWNEFRVRVDGKKSGPRWHSQTAITYYSTWQLLVFIECQDMGTAYFGNTEEWDWTAGVIPDSWASGGIRFEPIRSLRSFRKFERQLDAVVWFTEEEAKNHTYVLRHDHKRRLVEEHEHSEMERRTLDLARRCRRRFRVSYPQLVALIKFLCARWGDWERIGYQHHAKAYKSFIGRTVTLARYLRDVQPQHLFDDVGRVTGHFKPTLRVIFQDWAAEWREDAERLIVSFSRPDAILSAPFTATDANEFLDFVESYDIFEFYWRWKSLNERAFSGDTRHLAGLKSDLQGMALSVEHIASALVEQSAQKPAGQLDEKFKQIWKKDSQVGRLLRSNEYRKISRKQGLVDLDWFDTKQSGSPAEQVASELAICHAIRGNAHHQIAEHNQLQLERMSLVLLRGVVRAFIEARARWSITDTSSSVSH